MSARIAGFLSTVCLFFVLVPLAAGAQPAPKLPPGMTPEMAKMMMTPGAPHPKGLPAGVEPWGGCIPSMGYHYARKADIPFGPIYGYYQGKPVFTEIMIATQMFTAGKSWDNVLKPLPGYTIDHIDIWHEQHGHPGYQTPHYDIHAWYIPRSKYMYFCNNTSGKKPAFL